MKRIYGFFVVAALLLGLPTEQAFALPSSPTLTTLTTTIGTTDTLLTVASTTGMTGTTGVSASCGGAKCYILLDDEVMAVSVVASSTTLTVIRGQDTTTAVQHYAGRYVVFGFFAGTEWLPANTGSPAFGNFFDRGKLPTGLCNRDYMQYAPMFAIRGPSINGGQTTTNSVDCIGGKWTIGTWPVDVDVTAVRQCTIPMGSVALGSVGTDSTRVNGTIYVASIDVPATRIVGLLSALGGATTSTDLQVYALYDWIPGSTTSRTVATTALAGAVTPASANVFSDQNLTAATIVVGPARYGFAQQLNGANSSIRMVPTPYTSLLANSRTGTFGTLAPITIPTTFTTSTGPVGCIGRIFDDGGWGGRLPQFDQRIMTGIPRDRATLGRG